MSKPRSANKSRRNFIKTSVAAVAGLSCFNLGLKASVNAVKLHEDMPNTHNMMLVGTKSAFLSHLPMFVNPKSVGPKFDSPHRFQVILEATFTNEDRDLTEVYLKDRMKNPAVKMYTLNPGEFVLSHVDPNGSALKKFRGNALIRGHLEKGGTSFIGDFESPPEGGAFDVNVVNVVHFREFDPNAAKPAKLEYLLFGKSSELFLAHTITKPSDFDQIISIKIPGHAFTDEDLAKGMRIEFSDRSNTSKERLKEKMKAPGRLHIPAGVPQSVAVETVREFYFEEGELFMPPTFDATQEEKKAGFP